MKRLLIAASVLFLFTGATKAQSTQQEKAGVEKHQRGQFGRHHNGGFAKLNLTEDQKAQFKTLNESYRKQMTDLRSNKSLAAEDMKAKTQALRKEQFEKMQSFLTAEQKAQLAEQRKGFGEKGRTGERGRDFSKRGGDQQKGFGEKGRDFGRRGGDQRKGFGQMKTTLGLTDAQEAKLKASREGFHDKVKAIRSNSALSDEQKKEQVKALATERQESLKAILTPEQLEKMKAGRKNKFGSK
jgi:Spy/CpxP family protein refolding chaperone